MVIKYTHTCTLTFTHPCKVRYTLPYTHNLWLANNMYIIILTQQKYEQLNFKVIYNISYFYCEHLILKVPSNADYVCTDDYSKCYGNNYLSDPAGPS